MSSLEHGQLEIIDGSSVGGGFDLGTHRQVLCGCAASVRQFFHPDMRRCTPEVTFQNLHAILTIIEFLKFLRGSRHEKHTEVAGSNIGGFTNAGTSAVPQ
jgi:hypothetical protein